MKFRQILLSFFVVQFFLNYSFAQQLSLTKDASNLKGNIKTYYFVRTKAKISNRDTIWTDDYPDGVLFSSGYSRFNYYHFDRQGKAVTIRVAYHPSDSSFSSEWHFNINFAGKIKSIKVFSQEGKLESQDHFHPAKTISWIKTDSSNFTVPDYDQTIYDSHGNCIFMANYYGSEAGGYRVHIEYR